MSRGAKKVAPCERCGHPRVINGSRDAGVCADCRYSDPLWPYVAANSPA